MTVKTQQATVSKIWAVEGLRGMSFEDMSSVIDQLLDKRDCGPKIALLDIDHIYGSGDLGRRDVRILLHQAINE